VESVRNSINALWTLLDRNLGRLDDSAMRMQAHRTHSDSSPGIGTFVIPAAANGAIVPDEFWQRYEAMDESEASRPCAIVSVHRAYFTDNTATRITRVQFNRAISRLKAGKVCPRLPCFFEWLNADVLCFFVQNRGWHHTLAASCA
jgi:hypothetical protein